MSPDLERFLTVIAVVVLLLGLIALTRRAFRKAARITDTEALAACVAHHPSQVRTYCGTCGHEECVCGAGVGDQAEAWLRARGEVYDWSQDEGSGLT